MARKKPNRSPQSTADESHFSLRISAGQLGFEVNAGRAAAMVQSVLGYLLLAAALSPVVLGLGWAVWQGHVRPALIPKREIERLADEVLAEGHEDPVEVVEGYEYHAWRHSDGFEQGRWRRVRRAIQRRQEQ